MSKFIDALKGALTVKDSWTGPDKIKHLVAGFGAAMLVTLISTDYILGLSAGVAVAAGKEIYDAANSDTNTASIKDFVVTIAGAIAGSLVGNIVVTGTVIG